MIIYEGERKREEGKDVVREEGDNRKIEGKDINGERERD